MAGFSCGVEGVHLKDEKTCPFKRAVSPFPHAPPQPHRHSSCEHLWGSSCPLCLFVGIRIDFPEHHWRQDRALGRTPQVQTSMQPWPQLLWMPRWAKGEETQTCSSWSKTSRGPIKEVKQLDNPRGQFWVEGDIIGRSKSTALDWIAQKKVES